MQHVLSKQFPAIRQPASIPASFTSPTYNVTFHLVVHNTLLAFLLVCFLLSIDEWICSRSEIGVNRMKGDKVSEYHLMKQGFFNTKVNFKNAA